MADVDAIKLAVRAPTGSAWVATVAWVVVAGEVFYERSRSVVPTFLGMPFSSGESLVLLVVAAIAAVLSGLWLTVLYARPGHLRFGDGRLERARGAFRRRVIEAPLADWQVRITFFDAAAQARGDFKRVAIKGPGLQEVLLFGDVRRPAELLRALADASSTLGSYEVALERISE